MSRLGAALCAAVLACAAQARAASYSISFTPQPGDYRLYEFTFTGPFSAAVMGGANVVGIFLASRTGDDATYNYADFDWGPGCETSSGVNCQPKLEVVPGWTSEGGSATFGFDFTATTLRVLLDYEFIEYDHCATATEGSFCGQYVVGPGFDLTWDTDAPFSYTVATVAPVATPAPEPATWAFLVGGFGLMGAALRGRRSPRTARSGQAPAPPSSRW
jgi:hypothetical protein